MRRLLFLLPIVLAASPHPDGRTTVAASISPRRLRTSVAVDSNELIDEGSSAEFEQPRSRKRARSVASAVDSSKEDAKMYSTSLHGSRTRFLKNKLLDNLNKYFGEESGALEILSSEDPAPEGSWNSAPAPQQQQPLQWGQPPATNPWMQPQQHPQQPFPQQQPMAPHAVPPPGGNPWLAWTTPAPFQQPFAPPQQPPDIHPTLIPAPPPLDSRQQRSGPQPAFDWKAESKSRLVKQSSWEQSADRTITKTGMAGDTSGETQPQKLMTTQRVTPKKRKRGESAMNRDTMETIRSWRNRLYKAFKRHDGSNPHAMQPTRISRLQGNNTSGGSELLEFSNQTPLVADKNMQMLKSRDPQQHHVPRHIQQQPQTFGMDQNGKIAPMFGMERQGYRFTGQHQMPVDYSQPTALYLPPSAPQQYYTTPPSLPPAFYTTPSYYSTSPSPFTLFPPLKHSVLTYPPHPPSDGFYYKPTPPVTEPTPSPTLPTMLTPPPRVDQQEEFELGEESQPAERHSQMSGVTCADGSCNPVQLPQHIQEELTPINEDKCNSMRLKEIIERNIVPNDAEASKRAVQAVAEDVTGRYFDAICGTGFFSYIAHTDEFCQASAAGVNCYLFSPVCGNTQSNAVPFKKHRKRTTLLNKN